MKKTKTGDCEEEQTDSKDPANLPSSIVAPGSSGSWSTGSYYLSAVMCVVSLLVSCSSV